MRVLVVVLFILALIILVSPKAQAQLPSGSESATENPSTTEITELQKKADAGDVSAEFEIGRAYETGKGVPQNRQQAAFWYRKAAEQGNAKAQGSLGILYWLGEGVEKDKKQAVEWYRKAARQGNANAMFNLGAAYYDGEGVSADATRAYSWFLLASERGSKAGEEAAQRSRTEFGPRTAVDAFTAIAEMYEKGEELPKDLALAEKWYRRAVEETKESQAVLALAAFYLQQGRYGDARPWCEMAAKEYKTGGAFCLGYLYEHGFGVGQNLETAFHWYRKAASGGGPEAMLALGRMYENGQGTKADRPEAFLQFISAARHGNTDAEAEAIKVRSLMNEKEWKTTQEMMKKRNFDLAKVERFLKGEAPLR